MEQEHAAGRHPRSARLVLLQRLQKDTACLATMRGGIRTPDDLFAGTDRHCTTCESRAVVEALCLGELRHATNSWTERQADHEKTMSNLEHTLEQVRAENSEHQCDQADLNHFTLSEEVLPVSPSLSRLLDRSRDVRIACRGPKLRDSRLRQKSLRFVLMVERHEELGRKLRTELDRYSAWLELRAQNLQRNYERYCEIMVERCESPLVLYEDAEYLVRAKEKFSEASADREKAAIEAKESVYAGSRPDLLRALYCA